ncbi:MAG TPA: cation:proton antiporter regulatory subunit [Acidimicrobiia bacterium]|nr:cation:proton antiporter regulatory subunit [Acidimicrobiia bacterium]
MPKIEETSLPGVGVRHDFTAEDGSRIGVVHHRTGRRELFFCDADDPDAVTHSLNLSDEDSHALSEALGGSTLIENLEHLQQRIEGLAIDWLPLSGLSPYAGKTIGDARIRTRSGVSVVAVIRGDQAFPAPGPEFGIEADDTFVVVGTPEGIKVVYEILITG